MSWVETWLDTAVAPPLQTIIDALDQSGAKGINFYLGGRYLYGPARGTWTLQLALDLKAARPDVGIFGSWVSLQPGQGGYMLGNSDGQEAAYTAGGYPLEWLSYDVEPGVFDANPIGVAQAMLGFTDAVVAAGFKSMPYSVPRGLAAGSDNAQAIWIANPNPGGEDPAVQPLNDAFFAGKRSVQYGYQDIAGVGWDLSHSQFSLAGALTVPSIDPLPKPTYPYRRQHMKYVHWNNAEQLFRIKQDGTLVQAVNDGAGHWAQFDLGTGYVPGALEVGLDGPQLHLWALNPDGSVAHMWQDPNTSVWGNETIPNA